MQTASQDTLVEAVPDTSAILSRLDRSLDETSRLLRQGQFEEWWTSVLSETARYLPMALDALVKVLLLLVLTFLFHRIVGGLLHRFLRRSKRVQDAVEQLAMRVFRLTVFTFLTLMVLDQIGISITTLVAGIGIAGIAVGFAARDTFENMISGVTILLDQPFILGDNIEIEGSFGTVVEITLRSTRIKTLDNEIAVIPNVQMINQKLVNHTMLESLRVRIPFGIAYKEYPQQARDVVLALTRDDNRLDPIRSPDVVVTGMNDSSVDMELRLWLLDPKEEVPVRFEYLERVREALREADIEIPYPHLQLFVDEAKGLYGSALFPDQ